MLRAYRPRGHGAACIGTISLILRRPQRPRRLRRLCGESGATAADGGMQDCRLPCSDIHPATEECAAQCISRLLQCLQGQFCIRLRVFVARSRSVFGGGFGKQFVTVDGVIEHWTGHDGQRRSLNHEPILNRYRGPIFEFVQCFSPFPRPTTVRDPRG